MKNNIEEGIERMLFALSCVWMIFIGIIVLLSINSITPQFNPDRFIQGREPDFIDKTTSFFSLYTGEVILFTLIPIVSLWLLYYVIKWIIAGFRVK